MLSVQNITKEYYSGVVLKNVSFSLSCGEVVGLVAPNGTGKSTLLKLIADEGEVDSGAIIFQKGIKIAHFPQEVCTNISILQYLKNKEGENNNIAKLLKKVGLGDISHDRVLNELSGGQKSKVALAKILSTKADVYLLDEPTNNLDFITLKLMEEFIISSSSAFIVISHDREFLDRIVGKIFEIDEFTHSLRIYNGGYSDYLKQHEMQIIKEWAEYGDAQTKKKKLKKAIDKKVEDIGKINKEVRDRRKLATNITAKKVRAEILDRAGKIAKQGKSIKNKLQSYHLDETEKPRSRLPLKLHFNDIEQSGTKVFSIVCINKIIGDKHIGPIDLDILYGNRILILGDNGAGKTTFLKMLLGEITPDSGKIERGTKLCVGYLPQITDSDQSHTVLSFFKKNTPDKEEGDVRKTLNRFNLKQEDIDKTLNELSPGLRSRLVLATMMISKPNCLILDEPSNHLDLEVLEKLEDALIQYRGTIILVSHDRRLIRKIGFTKTYNLSNKGVLEEIMDVDKYIGGIT